MTPRLFALRALQVQTALQWLCQAQRIIATAGKPIAVGQIAEINGDIELGQVAHRKWMLMLAGFDAANDGCGRWSA